MAGGSDLPAVRPAASLMDLRSAESSRTLTAGHDELRHLLAVLGGAMNPAREAVKRLRSGRVRSAPRTARQAD